MLSSKTDLPPVRLVQSRNLPQTTEAAKEVSTKGVKKRVQASKSALGLIAEVRKSGKKEDLETVAHALKMNAYLGNPEGLKDLTSATIQ